MKRGGEAMEDFSDEEKDVMVVLYNLESMVDRGVLEGPKMLTDSGREHAKELHDDGWEVDGERLERALAGIQAELGWSPHDN